MRNIKLTIRYDGTAYSGWQAQKNSRRTIQAVMERAIEKITGAHSHLTGSGRTDAGVHALAQVANFKTKSPIPLKNLQMALNSELPKDIVVYKVEEAPARFDAQRSARSKHYRYTVMNNNFLDPFLRRYAAQSFYSIDIASMKRAAKSLVGRHNYSSFRSVNGGEKSAVRTVKNIAIKKSGDLITFDIEADGFLYNMVRCIVGTLIEVGRGKIPVEGVKDMLRRKDRRSGGPTMPAKGLCLVRVEYR
jgi:tRNA pseudouridine38-40 synthase